MRLVVDPHAQRVLGAEDDNGRSLGAATPLDSLANAHRRRSGSGDSAGGGMPAQQATHRPAITGANLVELALQMHHDGHAAPVTTPLQEHKA
ncbi:MAG: hypothetical protein RL014_1356 [Pseudomonadota bacterium]